MTFRFECTERSGAELRRIAAEQVEKALAELDALGDGDAAVHAVRTRCKKLRALLRLARTGLGARYAQENAEIRALARSLSSFRDAKIVLAAHDELAGQFGAVLDGAALARVRAALSSARSPAGAALGHRLAEVRAGLERLAERVEEWSLERDGGDVLAQGLERTYRKTRRALRRATRNDTAEEFHALRKGAKSLWYQLRLVEPLVETSLKRRIRRANKVADLLGDAHDLAVYEHRLGELAGACDPTAVETLRALAVWRRGRLEERALALGRRLLARKPKRFAARLGVPAPAAVRKSA